MSCRHCAYFAQLKHRGKIRQCQKKQPRGSSYQNECKTQPASSCSRRSSSRLTARLTTAASSSSFLFCYYFLLIIILVVLPLLITPVSSLRTTRVNKANGRNRTRLTPRNLVSISSPPPVTNNPSSQRQQILPGVVVFVSQKTALISHEIASRVVSELRQPGEIDFPIRLRKVQCDFADAVKAVYEMSNLDFRISFLLTDVCPDVNFRLSQVLKFRNISMITASDNNPAFRDRTLYPNTFSIVPSTESLARATLKFLQQNDWKKLLIVYDAHTPASHYYSLISSSLLRYLEYNQIDVGRPIENKGFDATMQKIQKSGFKIVFLLMPANEIADFLCRYAEKTVDVSVTRLAWLLHSDVADIPIEILLQDKCSGLDNLKLLTAFAVRFAPYNLMENDTNSELMPLSNGIMCSVRANRQQQQQLRYPNKLVLRTSDNINNNRYLLLNNNATERLSHYYRCYYYDGLVAIFRTLRSTIGQNEVLLSSGDYDTALWSNFKQLRIDGKTGSVRFNRATCERLGQVEIVQLANGRPRWIVVFDLSASYSPARPYRSVKWPRGRPPLDSVIRREELLAVPFELLAAFSAAALLGCAASVGILITNIRFQGHSYIKMSSPNLNNFILIGSCLCYINVIFQGLGTNLLLSTRLFEAVCIVESWTLPIGFSLAFGAMLTKTWRVHTIFRHATGLRRQVIPDSKLIFVVFLFVMLDVLLNTMWALFDTQTRETTVVASTLAEAYETTSLIESCSSSYALWWTLIMWLPKGALLIYGLFLAWKTRGVHLDALNDSYQIGVSIYIIVVMCTIGATAQPLFKTKVIISYCVLSTTLLLCTVVPEVVIFLPKLWTLWKDPIGDQRDLRNKIKLATKQKQSEKSATELTERYVTNEIRTRRCHLSELNDDISKLETQISKLNSMATSSSSTTTPGEDLLSTDHSLSVAVVSIGASCMAPSLTAVKENEDGDTTTAGISQIEDEQSTNKLLGCSVDTDGQVTVNKSESEQQFLGQILEESSSAVTSNNGYVL